MTIKPYPALNDDGWITEIVPMLDAIVSDFYMAEYSQDYIFAKAVTSFPKILELYSDNIEEVAIKTRGALQQLLLKYFDDAVVEVNNVPNDSDMAAVMSIFIKVTRGKETTSLRNLLRINNTRLEDVRKILDGV